VTGRLEADIRSWSREVVEVPNPHLPNDMPACPFAAKAWQEGRVEVRETDHPMIDLLDVCHEFPADKDLVILASTKEVDIGVFENFIEWANDAYQDRDLFLMGFHPDYGAEEQDLDFLYEHEWQSAVEEDYCMIFVQSLRQVVDYSNRLEKLGYYAAFPEEEYQQLVVERRRRLTNGDETPCDEEEGRQEGHGPWGHEGEG